MDHFHSLKLTNGKETFIQQNHLIPDLFILVGSHSLIDFKSYFNIHWQWNLIALHRIGILLKRSFSSECWLDILLCVLISFQQLEALSNGNWGILNEYHTKDIMIKNIEIARNKFYCEISEVVINLEGDKEIGTNFLQK